MKPFPGQRWNPLLVSLLSTDFSPHQVPMVVCFGRPGSGKTTVATAAVEALLGSAQVGVVCASDHDDDDDDSKESILVPRVHPVGLDLDVCVPQWMRDNFAKGRYPTLEERIAFAESACQHVEESLRQEADRVAANHQKTMGAVISFSFVNTDLRDIFRGRFPQAGWYLVDTSEEEAAERIRQREGHFYKGKTEQPQLLQQQQDLVSVSNDDETKRQRVQSDNDDWAFAPVNFPHTVLNGMDPVEANGRILAQALLEAVLQKQ